MSHGSGFAWFNVTSVNRGVEDQEIIKRIQKSYQQQLII